MSLIAASPLLLDAQSLFAAATEEAPQEEPVWVLSYASFIFYATAVIMIAIFFSKRRETLLDLENQKKKIWIISLYLERRCAKMVPVRY